MRDYLLPTIALLLLAGTSAFGCSDASTETSDSGGSASTSAALSHVEKSGKKLFDEGISGTPGNGRTCGTCHVAGDAFALTPATVEERYQALQKKRAKHPTADDALFRAIDANDGANDFTNLRQHALVRVVIKLPVDAGGNKLIWPVDDPNVTEVSVWRAVPSVLNTAITAPYQLDGRSATLQIQAAGAFSAHSQIDSVDPAVLDDISAFEKGLFSSPRIRKLSDAIANNRPLPPTDPDHLTPIEVQGKALFDHHCTGCHGGPSQTQLSPMLPPGTHDIFVSKPVPPFASDLPFDPSPLTPRLWAFRGVPGPIPSTDPGQALLTGSVNDLNHFDFPSLYGISKSAPYFHDNSAKDLEAVIRQYQSVFTGLRRVIPDFVPFPIRPDEITNEEVAPLIAYLKRI